MTAQTGERNSVKAAAARLLEDLESKTPSVPAEIVWAYQDEKVQGAIEDRLHRGEIVDSVRPMLPDIVTKYRRVLISFSSPDLPGRVTHRMLVQINQSNMVVDLIEPFTVSESSENLLAESDGVFSVGYSAPLQRGRGAVGASALTQRFEKFVNEEGIGVAFSRLRSTFGAGTSNVLGGGGFFSFESGTCVITTKRIPTMGPPGAPDPFPGTEGVDADEQEDDTSSFF